MTEPKHTHGPWKVAEGKNAPTYRGNTVVMDVADRWVAVTHICGQQGEAEANARLIAAAPELLEACEDIWRAWAGGDDAGRDLIEPIDAARRAIAKAKGESL